jgi:hypothetical protein
MEALLDAIKPTKDGRIGIEADEVLQFVRAQPEVAVAACRALLQVQDKAKGYGQLAVAIAQAYEAEFEDDTVLLLVQDYFAKHGQPLPRLTFLDEAENGSVIPASELPIRFEVTENELKRKDIYRLLSVCSRLHAESESALERLRELRGRLLLTFPIPLSDAREVWEVPEVREFVAAAAEVMPYLPYFLSYSQNFGMFRMYFSCLLPPEAAAGGVIDFDDAETFAVVGTALNASMLLARGLGQEDDQLIREMLPGMGEQSMEALLEALHEISVNLGS